MVTAKNALNIVLDIDEVDVDDDYNSEAALHCRFWEKFISCRIRLLSRTPTKEWRETQRNSRVVPSPQTPISCLIYDLIFFLSLIPNISKMYQMKLKVCHSFPNPIFCLISYPQLQQKDEEKLKKSQGLSPVPKPQFLFLIYDLILYLIPNISKKWKIMKLKVCPSIPNPIFYLIFFISVCLLCGTPTKDEVNLKKT